MSRHKPLFIEETNLSHAWARALLQLYSSQTDQLAPLTVTVTAIEDGYPKEDARVRQALDETLKQEGRATCNTVANTIFPASLWNPGRGRDSLFGRYRNIAPRLRSLDAQNRYGLYFERLVAYGDPPMNQLERVISNYENSVRRKSALQAGIFSPHVDHTRQRRRGFPCLQQVAFTPLGNDALAITGFYASQYLFERAYGNYLGLCGLGRFMAHELGLRFVQMSCVSGFCPRSANKRNLAVLLAKLEAAIGQCVDGAAADE